MLSEAVASDEFNAACHYNLGSSYQALKERAQAIFHFKRAIALGMSERNIEDFILQNPAIGAVVARIEEMWPLSVKDSKVLSEQTLEAIANDIFFRCALELAPLHGIPIERLLTVLRAALLVRGSELKFGKNDSGIESLVCAIAQQCFINEYVFAESEEETQASGDLKEMLLQKLTNGHEIPPLLLAQVAAYIPLHSLPEAHALLNRPWPDIVVGVVRQQLREPLDEVSDRGSIPRLTPVADNMSLQVMEQYEENPYPRWIVGPLVASREEYEIQSSAAVDQDPTAATDVLIAGCGTGWHALQVALLLPTARILAVDISLPSLAYARRKTRQEGVQNIEYAQADILKLGNISRSFDRIEAVGVLHHLAEPETGWRTLLSLLRPGGKMRVGLYSDTARRFVVEARALITKRGFRSTIEDIRACRQEIIRDERWRWLTTSGDFYSTSGCRDLLFHVMEHRFTIPRIKTFLSAHDLSFLGFELKSEEMEAFDKRFPEANARENLDDWHAFEDENPQTFRHMYIFTVRKN